MPNFSCPPIKVVDFNVKGTPKDLVWYTSKPEDLSSAALKKGGTFYGFLGDIPNSFRYMGPGIDELCVKLFNTQMPFLWISYETLEFMPCAATHWAVDVLNKTVYYKLNENMLWSDGSPCTTEDWVFANKFSKSKKIIDPLANRKHNNLRVNKIDNYCLSVQVLDDQNYTEYELLDITNFKPIARHFYGDAVPDNWIEKYNRLVEPTTGPYILANYSYKDGLRFTKVKNWWAHEYPHFRAIANFDEIIYRIVVGNKNPAFRKFAQGLFDIMHIEDPAEQNMIEASFDVDAGFINIWLGRYIPIVGPSGLFFNTKHAPFDNISVRKGMYYTIDIDGLILNFYADKQSRLHTIGSGQTWGEAAFNNNKIRKPEFNPKKAMKLFAEAGYDRLNSSGILIDKTGKELSFVILYDNSSLHEAFGFLYAQALKAGVKLEFRQMGSKIIDKLSNGDFQAWWGTLPAYQIPNNYQFLHSSFANAKSFNNFFGYSNLELDSLLEKYQSPELTYHEKADINCKIEELVDDAALMIPSFYSNNIEVAAWKWICFPSWLNMKYQKDLTEPMFGYMWFDKEIETECINAKAENKVMSTGRYYLSERYK